MKKLTQLFTFSLLIVALCVFLGSCGDDCVHSYDNECDATCNECGEERETDGHRWNGATCDKPKTCEICGETEGSAEGHKWAAATCDTPKRCRTCGKTDGAALGHKPDADDGDCTTDILCSRCDIVVTEGNEAHSPAEDDGDCTTALGCLNCEAVVVEAKEHDLDGNYIVEGDGHAHYCTNENCEYVGDKVSHEASGIIDSDNLERCECGIIVADHGHVHSGTVLKHDANGHWYECTCGNVMSSPEGHTMGADDGDCTTHISCDTCPQLIINGYDAHIDEDGNGVCDRDGCNKAVGGASSGDNPSDSGGGTDLPIDEND